MFFYRLKRILLERDVLVSVIVLGLMMVIADTFGDFNRNMAAAITRIIGIVVLIAIFAFDQWSRRRKSMLKIPLMFTSEADRQTRRAMFAGFLASTELEKSLKIVSAASSVRSDDVIIPLDPSLRETSDRNVWRNVWRNALRDWEENVDRPLLATPFNESGCYHIFPHAALPMSFALGASVNLRRPVVLYHQEDDTKEMRPALNLSNPRRLFETAAGSTPHPKIIRMPEEITPSSRRKKLILHLAISARHPVALRDHPDHSSSDNVALNYDFDLAPATDWLSYAQRLFEHSKHLVADYEQVDICLMGPSAVAFALGMAFSRNPRITVCHRLNNQYLPVFSLVEIEKRLPFD